MARYRITESRLRGMIQEEVKNALRETYNFASSEPQFDINSPKYAQMYDRDRGYDMFDYWTDEDDERVANYEKLPDKVRHPYGAECPDFSDRIRNRPWKVKASDKLAQKEPNSIVKKRQEKINKQQEKIDFQKDLELSKHHYPFATWCRNNGINREQLQDDEIVNLFRDYVEDKFQEKERWTEYEDY